MAKPAWLRKLHADRAERKDEMDRILALPEIGPLEKHRIEEISRECVQAHEFDQGYRLFPGQAAGLDTYRRFGGVFGRIAVGGGKTDLLLLLANQAFSDGIDRILLLVPPDLCKQLQWRDLPRARRILVFNTPVVTLHKKDPKKRAQIVSYKQPGLYIMPYSLLSTRDTIDLLQAIDADLVLADEAQALWDSSGNPSAKTKRFWSWFRERNPRLVAVSGTTTNRSPLDYHRLAQGALKENCFLPETRSVAETWGECLESGAEPSGSALRDMQPLLDWAGTEDLRAAYKRRMLTAPGVVSVEDNDLGISIRMRNQDLTVPPEILTALADVEDDWTNPDGEIFKFALDKHRLQQELSAGLWHRQVWPTVDQVVEDLKKHGEEGDEDEFRELAEDLLHQAQDRHELGQVFGRELRAFFSSQIKPRKGLDTPWAVCQWLAQKGDVGVPDGLYDAWEAWHKLDDPLLPERLSEPVRVSNFKVKAAVEWAKKIKTGGVIWCHNTELQAWICEELRAAGLPVLHKGAGTTWLLDDGSDEFFCVASIASHHKGKNLQHHRHQLIVQFPRSAPLVEQLMGRLHRPGQKAPELVVDTLVSTTYDHMTVRACLRDTEYDRDTVGGKRKLLLADWAWEPRTFTEDQLERAGFGEEEE